MVGLAREFGRKSRTKAQKKLAIYTLAEWVRTWAIGNVHEICRCHVDWIAENLETSQWARYKKSEDLRTNNWDSTTSQTKMIENWDLDGSSHNQSEKPSETRYTKIWDFTAQGPWMGAHPWPRPRSCCAPVRVRGNTTCPRQQWLVFNRKNWGISWEFIQHPGDFMGFCKENHGKPGIEE